MKKFFYVVSSLAAITIPVASTISCIDKKGKKYVVKSKFDNPLEFKGEKATTKKVGVVVSDPENPRWQKAKNFADSYGKMMFGEHFTQILKSDQGQKEWFNTKQANIDGLVVGASTDSFSPWATTWKTAQKPVVAFDRLIKTSNRKPYNWYVTYDNGAVGKMQGIAILNKLYNKKWTFETPQNEITTYVTNNNLISKNIILSVAGDPADNNSKFFFNGAMDLFKIIKTKDPNFVVPDGTNIAKLANFTDFNRVAQANWNYASAQTFLNTEIGKITKTERSKITAVLSPNDGMATAAINALKNNALDPMKVYITGQDSNDSAILSISGKKLVGQDMTISKPDRNSMAIAMSLLLQLINYPKYNVSPNAIKSDNTIDEQTLINKIKADFPNIKMRYDSTTYKASIDKPINTLILSPNVITKDNIGPDKIFEIMQK